MAVEGSLSELGMADLCQLLSMGRKTGCLTLSRTSNLGYVFLDQGRVVHATVLNRPDRLGELLVRNGLVTRDDLRAASKEQGQRPRERIGRILVEQGSLSEEDLQRFVALQVEEAVYHLFTWDEGTFHFEPDRTPAEGEGVQVAIPVENLLLEGARRVDELSVIRERIPSDALVYRLEQDASGIESAELSRAQRRLIEFIDGTRTVAELIEESGLVEFDVLQGLFGLLKAGYVHEAGTGDPEAVGAAPADALHRVEVAIALERAGMLEDAEHEYRAALAGGAPPVPTGLRLGVLLLRAGRPGEALAELDGALAAFDGPGGGSGRAPGGAGDPSAGERADGMLPSLHLNRAVALERLGRHDEALDELGRAEEAGIGPAWSLLLRAILLLRKRDAAGAMAALARLRTELPGPPSPAWFSYAVLAAHAAGDPEEAVALGREGISHYPECAPILVNFGAVLEEQGDLHEAEALYLRATARRPPSPHAHRNLGALAERRGDGAGARAHYERVLRMDPELGGDLHLRLGDLAHDEGDQDGARTHWERALERDPSNDRLRRRLDLLPTPPRS